MAQKLIRQSADFTLGYWGIRGLGQPIRAMLACAGVPFSEIRLGVLQDGTLMDKDAEEEDWATVRSTLESPFPNLPFLIHTSAGTSITLTQSNTILRYLARQLDFYGDSEHERTEIDQLQDEAYDFRNEIIATAYTLGVEYSNVFEHFANHTLPRYLDGFEAYLAKREVRTCFVGKRLSLVDFVLYELIWQMTKMVPGSICHSSRPTLQGFINAFESIPEIVAYRKSDTYIEHPINSPWASFA
jgi:glutathione S-transferase